LDAQAKAPARAGNFSVFLRITNKKRDLESGLCFKKILFKAAI